MTHTPRTCTIRVRLLLAVLAVFATAATLLAQSSGPIGPDASSQIQALLLDKEIRTPEQRKVDSNLLYEARQRHGEAIAAGVATLQTGVEVDARGRVVVDITAPPTDSVLGALETLGGRVLDMSAAFRSIRAEMPLAAVEMLAAHPDVIFINRKQEAMLNGVAPPPPLRQDALRAVSATVAGAVRPGFVARAAAVRDGLSAALRPDRTAVVNVSEGVVTHRANIVHSSYGITGAGVKVGVLSDGVDSLATLQASGDLPAVTVLSGQAGSGDEGSAMLEIVHDVAPGAQLYFASAFAGIAAFAQNILNLRAAGCDIIVDDVTYYAESPFQMGQAASVISTTNGGIVTQAVMTVTASGALYFSSAANSGSMDKNTSGTWEGDFADAGPVGVPIPEGGELHDFDLTAGVVPYDVITTEGRATALTWSDPLGAAANDYDLFLLNSAGTAVVSASTNFQNGTQDPFEIVGSSPLGDRVVVVKFFGSARFLHVSVSRGRLTFGTMGATFGHNASPSPNAFGVAATPVSAAYPNPFSSSNTIETFSSDGPRHYFFNADSTAITPGNLLSTGGTIYLQPRLTAADGVSCAAPGFNPFYGTSAAAPHAGAIAALVKSAKPSLTQAQISSALTTTAIDIEAAGQDRDSGSGIVDALAAVESVVTSPHAILYAGTVTPIEVAGNGDGFLEPGECGSLTVQLKNGSSLVGATGISATLTSSTPGVVIVGGTSSYPNITAGGNAVNSAPFLFTLPTSIVCPSTVSFTLTVSYTGGPSPLPFNFSLLAGTPPVSVTTTLDTIAPVPVSGVTSAATGLQNARLNRNAVVSSCASPKSFPGTFGTGQRRYDAYTFNNCVSDLVCVRVTLTQTSGSSFELYAAAYAGPFDPNDLGTSGYLADQGSSVGLGATASFTFQVDGGSLFEVVVNELDAGIGLGANYTLTVEGACLPCPVISVHACGPTVTTNAATAVGSISATLHATVNPNGADTIASFDYGKTSSYGTTLTYGSVGSGTSPLALGLATAVLECNTLYHFRARASSSAGSANGNDLTFTTGSCSSPPSVVPSGLGVDLHAAPGTASNLNGVLEPGESVRVEPSWHNNSGGSIALTGTAWGFHGPSGATYTLDDTSANYGTVSSGGTANCNDASANCFRVSVSNPASRPATHWDANVMETTSSGQTTAWILHVGSSFTDAPPSNAFSTAIETLLHNGITAGCTPTTYCPGETVFRVQMAAFLARAQAKGDGNVPSSGTVNGNPYNCSPGGTSLFSDVPPTDPFCRHVHYIYATGVTSGCEPGKYCPAPDVTRAQMAMFVSRAITGSDAAVPQTYGPDPGTGFSYSCNPANPALHFSDITTSDIFCRHVHYLWATGVISGYQDGTYKPASNVTRDQMAKFLVNGFKLRLYGP